MSIKAPLPGEALNLHSPRLPCIGEGMRAQKSRLQEGDGVEGWDYARSKLR